MGKLFAELDPTNPADWGPSVRYERADITPSSRPGGQLATDFPVGKKKDGSRDGNIVTAVKFVNVGTNSSVKIGRDQGTSFETIPRTGAAEISFGEGFPLHICDNFRVIWEPTGSGTHVHKVLVVMTVVNF